MYHKVKRITLNQYKINTKNNKKNLKSTKIQKKINPKNIHTTSNELKKEKETGISNMRNNKKQDILKFNNTQKLTSIDNNKQKNDQEEFVTIDTASPINLTSDKNLLIEFKTLNGVNNYQGVGNTVINITGSGYLPVIESKDKIKYLYTYYTPENEDLIISAYQLKNTCGYYFNKDFTQLNNSTNSIPVRIVEDTTCVKLSDIILDLRIYLQHTGNSEHYKKIKKILKGRTKENISLIEAHLRLNHIPAQVIRKSIRNNIFDDVKAIEEMTSKNNLWCETCCAGKMTRHFHYTDSMNHYIEQKQPGSSWSLDIFGPVNRVSATTDKYMLLMVDNVSRYIIITTHKNKNSNTINDQINKNIEFIKTQFDRKIREFIMDKGSEFTNPSFKKLLEDRGIIPIYTSTNDHSANARAERNIRTIITDVRTLLLQANLSINFWPYAARTAVNVRNCTYNKKIQTAPITLLSHNSVRILLRSFLPFGTPALVWDHGVKKTSAPGKKATVLCKDPYGFGYLFYVPYYRKIVSTVNYELPVFKVKQENNNNIDVGIFKKLSDKTLGEYMDQTCDENEIEEVFSITESNSPELMASLEEDERLIKEQLIRDIEDDKADDRNDVINKDPVNIDHETLEEFFEDSNEKEWTNEEAPRDTKQYDNETNIENENEISSNLEEDPDYYPNEGGDGTKH